MAHEVNTKGPITQPARRSFFQWIAYGLSGVAALAVGVPLIGYVLGVRRTKPAWVVLDEVEKFPLEETRLKTFDNPLRQPWDGITGFTGVYVRRTSAGANPQFLVFAVNCAHLGCPVSWFPQSGLFMCPCHGGVYYANGEHASGPPPRGLFHCEWRVNNGRLEVRAPHYPSLQDTLTKES
jgi:menaquinol-cytochrome c reductase iron-sulfur subunit